MGTNGGGGLTTILSGDNGIYLRLGHLSLVGKLRQQPMKDYHAVACNIISRTEKVYIYTKHTLS